MKKYLQWIGLFCLGAICSAIAVSIGLNTSQWRVEQHINYLGLRYHSNVSGAIIDTYRHLEDPTELNLALARHRLHGLIRGEAATIDMHLSDGFIPDEMLPKFTENLDEYRDFIKETEEDVKKGMEEHFPSDKAKRVIIRNEESKD